MGFGYHKYVRSVDVTDLKEGDTLMIKRLRAYTDKEVINKEEFEQLREEMVKEGK